MPAFTSAVTKASNNFDFHTAASNQHQISGLADSEINHTYREQPLDPQNFVQAGIYDIYVP